MATSQPLIEQLFTASRTSGGQVVSYPEGIPEIRVYRITIPVGAKIPLHIHPSPVVVVVEKGRLSNVLVSDGFEVSETLESGEGFLEGHPAEPHYVINRGIRPVASLVTFASVEGMPNQIQLRP